MDNDDREDGPIYGGPDTTIFAGVVAVDPSLRRFSEAAWVEKVARARRPTRIYPSAEAALAAFRTVPEQPVAERIRRHVAGRSIRAIGGGWQWKFDPAVYDRPQYDLNALGPTATAVWLIRAEFGSSTIADAQAVSGRLGAQARVVTMLGARHHMMFDQPLGLRAAIAGMLRQLDGG